eukprot:1338335-Rhodomonas_salina.3
MQTTGSTVCMLALRRWLFDAGSSTHFESTCQSARRDTQIMSISRPRLGFTTLGITVVPACSRLSSSSPPPHGGLATLGPHDLQKEVGSEGTDVAISLKNLGLVNKELAQHDSGGTLQTQRQETAFLTNPSLLAHGTACGRPGQGR